MYSNDQTQIKQGFVNYIGALINSSPFEGKAAQQEVTALLMEEILKLSQTDGENCDLYVLKPVLRAVVFVFKQRIVEIRKLPAHLSAEPIKRYETFIAEFETLINSL